MVVAINDNLEPIVFQTIKGYKYWCERQVEKGTNPDEIIVNNVHQLNEGEKPTEDNWIDIHDFHRGLYSRINTIKKIQ